MVEEIVVQGTSYLYQSQEDWINKRAIQNERTPAAELRYVIAWAKKNEKKIK
jgi:hypothetical protein